MEKKSKHVYLIKLRIKLNWYLCKKWLKAIIQKPPSCGTVCACALSDGTPYCDALKPEVVGTS